MKYLGLVSFLILIILFAFPNLTDAANPLDVVINEIAWMGRETSYTNEWIELYNNANSPVNLEGWMLKATDGTPEINLARTVLAQSFYLLERNNDNIVPGIPADQIYAGALNNGGENLELYDNLGNLIDSVNCSTGWFAGNNETKQTMERINSQLPGNLTDNWQASQKLEGTPRAQNSNPKIQPKLPSLKKPEAEPPRSGNESSVFYLPLLIALAIAIFSGAIILFLKHRIKAS